MFFKRLIQLFQTTPSPKPVDHKVGIIKFFNRRKGFGFIRSRQTEDDIFVHISDAENPLDKGDKVIFEVERNDKGLRAKNVERISY